RKPCSQNNARRAPSLPAAVGLALRVAIVRDNETDSEGDREQNFPCEQAARPRERPLDRSASSARPGPPAAHSRRAGSGWLAPCQKDVVAEKTPTEAQPGWPVPGSAGDTTAIGEQRRCLGQSAFPCHADQVDFQESGQVGRVQPGALLERRELV